MSFTTEVYSASVMKPVNGENPPFVISSTSHSCRSVSWRSTVQESIAAISHRAQENFGGIRVVKGYAREDSQADQFEGTSAVNRDNQVLLGNARGLTNAAIYGSFDMTFAVILLIGGLAAVDRTLPIGDLFKLDVFELARRDLRIPRSIVEAPPSAELRPDQRDDDSLPPYERLDPLLNALIANESIF